MRIKIDGKSWRLSWAHINGDESIEEDQRLLAVCIKREGSQANGYAFFVRVKGHTSCYLTPIEAPLSEDATGEAWCSTLDDFSKEEGRKHSLYKAMLNLQLTRSQRTQVWEQYHSRK